MSAIDTNLVTLFFAAFAWGCAWAGVLQWTRWGRKLVVKRTWVTVVIGTAGNLALLLWAFDLRGWLIILGVFAASSIGIIVRSVHNELRDEDEDIKEARHA